MSTRFEVVITTYHCLDSLCGGPRVTIKQYRWRWRARWACFLINNMPSPNVLLFGYEVARWRPILRVVPSLRRVA